MSFVTSKGYVRPETRIQAIEEISIIKGSISSGATPRYMSKEDYPKLGGLVEDGFAMDEFLPKDKENRRMIIAFNEANEEIDFESRLKLEEKSEIAGVLDQGVADGSRAMIEPGKEDNYVLVWYNGNWALIEKYLSGDQVLIPEELANEIYKSTKYTKKQICDGFSHVSAKEVASLSSCSSIYSQWTFQGVLYVMINTKMKDGPYKFRRTDYTFDIQMKINFVKRHFINNYKDYMHPSLGTMNACVNEILSGFKLWGGSYGTEQTKFENGVTVNLSVSEYQNMLQSASVEIINQMLSGSKNVSNVNDVGWEGHRVGEMQMFTHQNGMIYDPVKLRYVAAHEFGHFLGLGDAYIPGDGTDAANYVKEAVDPNDIMMQSKEGSKITPNDIEMLFLAVLKNTKQYFHTDGEDKVSQALIIEDLN